MNTTTKKSREPGLYVVQELVSGPTEQNPLGETREHLVSAYTQSGAIKTIAAPRFCATRASARVAARLVSAGVQIIDGTSAE